MPMNIVFTVIDMKLRKEKTKPTSVTLQPKTYNALLKLGTMMDSLDSVIWRLVEFWRSKHES